MTRPPLNKQLSSVTFRNHYYLKEELVAFCKQEIIQTTGNKVELTNRIAHFLETGEKLTTKRIKKSKNNINELALTDFIETNFICSEVHRSFYKKHIGKTFSFNVKFQQWLKQNAGKTYQESIEAYFEILKNKKTTQTSIDLQFEYNTYIRDFFKANKGLSLNDGIRCWKYKKNISGPNKFEMSDLDVLSNKS